jgi:hypothetical protein
MSVSPVCVMCHYHIAYCQYYYLVSFQCRYCAYSSHFLLSVSLTSLPSVLLPCLLSVSMLCLQYPYFPTVSIANWFTSVWLSCLLSVSLPSSQLDTLQPKYRLFPEATAHCWLSWEAPSQLECNSVMRLNVDAFKRIGSGGKRKGWGRNCDRSV